MELSTWSESSVLPGIDHRLADLPSPFSVLMRVARMNCMSRSYVAKAVTGTRAMTASEFNDEVCRGRPIRRRLLEFIGATPAIETPTWQHVAWLAARTPSPRCSRFGTLTVCPECIAYGLHCLQHQAGRDATCSLHGQPLITTCPQCDRELSRFVEEAATECICDCGWDPLHRGDAASLEGLDARLLNARQEALLGALAKLRKHHVWVGPRERVATPRETSRCIEQASKCGTLAPSAPEWRPATDLSSDAWCWAHCEGPHQLNLMAIPTRLLTKATEVTREVIDDFAPKPHPRRFVGVGIEIVAEGAPTLGQPRTPFILPISSSSCGLSWIATTSIARPYLSLCRNLVDYVGASNSVDLAPYAVPLSDSAALAKTLQRTPRIDLVFDVLESCLMRGYSIGLREVLAPILGKSNGLRRISSPSIVLRMTDGELSSALLMDESDEPPRIARHG